MRLIDEIRAGKRTVVVSTYSFGQEKDYVECKTIEEATALVSAPMAAGHRRGLPDWQWVDDYGDEEFDPFGQEVAEVHRAVGIVPFVDVEHETYSEP